MPAGREKSWTICWPWRKVGSWGCNTLHQPFLPSLEYLTTFVFGETAIVETKIVILLPCNIGIKLVFNLAHGLRDSRGNNSELWWLILVDNDIIE